MAYDLVLTGGTLIDPAQGIHGKRDIAFQGGTVAEIGTDLSHHGVTAVIDCSGMFVSPGWIDLHVYNVDGPVFDMATTISKFFYLGLSMDDALAKATAYPAQVLGKSDQIGSLKTGASGDAVVFRLESGSFDFLDSNNLVRTGSQRLVPVKVIRSGKVYG